jgi:hypothetical protein
MLEPPLPREPLVYPPEPPRAFAKETAGTPMSEQARTVAMSVVVIFTIRSFRGERANQPTTYLNSNRAGKENIPPSRSITRLRAGGCPRDSIKYNDWPDQHGGQSDPKEAKEARRSQNGSPRFNPARTLIYARYFRHAARPAMPEPRRISADGSGTVPTGTPFTVKPRTAGGVQHSP